MLLLTGACRFGVGDEGEEHFAPPVATVQRTDFERVVIVSGRVIAAETLSAPLPFDGPVAWCIAEGKDVAVGEPLIVLGTDVLEHRLATLAAQAETARADLEREQGALRELDRRLELERAGLAAEETVAASRRHAAERELTEAERRLAARLVRAATIEELRRDRAEQRVQDEIDAVQRRLRAEELDADRVAAAARVRRAEVVAEELDARRQRMEERIALATVRSPAAGRVQLTRRRFAAGESPRPVRVGDRIGPAHGVLVAVAVGDERVVECPLPESVLGELRQRQVARVRPLGESGTTRMAELETIAPVGLTDGDDPSVIVFTSRFRLEPDRGGEELAGFGLGANVSVVVPLVTETDVLVVPSLAACGPVEAPVAFVVGEEDSPRTLVLGASDGEHVVVRSGLREGERVLLGLPASRGPS